MSYKGFFKPKFPKKYAGNPKNIVYRSQWEFKKMYEFDHDPKVIQWASEEFSIPYVSPTDNQWHRYFPDFWVKQADGRVVVYEVKPLAQCKLPTTTNKRRLLKESLTYAKNLAKWEAARKFCDEKGWHFKILTEKEIFGRNV